jgi:hypothetical protein
LLDLRKANSWTPELPVVLTSHQRAHDVWDTALLCSAQQLKGGLAAAWTDAYPTPLPAVRCVLAVTRASDALTVTLSVAPPPAPLGGFPAFFEDDSREVMAVLLKERLG